ncbi:hypothetical protein C8Q75DRAFT_473719 [Abortiporus biennis]|nr:hypothetical protein C8Q75DRAFT_473719 [Abortiporus biennis]
MHSPLHPSLASANFGRPFHLVTRLEVFSCSFGSVLDIRRLMDSFFPYVIDLMMRGVRIRSSHVLLPPKLAQKKQPSLSSLSVLTNDVPLAIPQWLSWSLTQNSLDSLSIYATDLPKMLSSFGRYLRHLNLQWNMREDKMNENLSFSADVLPALQTLNIAALYHPPLVRAFCRVVSRSSLSSSLSCIQIECLPIKSNQQACNVLLDDTLAQLHDHVQIEILKKYSRSLLKLKSKGVLVDRFGYLCTRK